MGRAATAGRAIAMRVTIRRYQSTDRDHLAQCIDAITDMARGVDPWHRVTRTRDHTARWPPFYLRIVEKNDGFILVAEADGERAGVAIAWVQPSTALDHTTDLPTKIGFVGELSVLPAWRGRGIGTRLVRECERRFRAAGCDQLSLFAFAPNRQAIRLYRREGYEPRAVRFGKLLGPAKRRWPPTGRKSKRGRSR
jgi:ribosomal protein S18 acetylase RimI-like enzyme